MKVLYDHQAFTNQYVGGVSKCFCELISHMPNNINYSISIEESNNIHLLESKIACDCKPVSRDVNNYFFGINFKGRRTIYNYLSKMPFWHTTEHVNKQCSIKALKNEQFDVFHPTYFDDYFLDYLGNKPFVITIHDMTPELFPNFLPHHGGQSSLKRMLCEKAAAIVAVSHQTKHDLIKLFNIPDKKICVIHHGGPTQEKISEEPIINGKYLLYVGQRNGYKNFYQTLQDFAIIRKSHGDIRMVCAGTQFSSVEKETIAYLGLSNCIVQIRPSDKELKNLYAFATAFIYPSIYEGFGMPTLEAFAYGCPVLLNNKSCFPEVGGDAAIYFNSVNGHSDLPEYVDFVLKMSSEQKEQLVLKGYERLKHFSWKQSSLKLSELYCSLL